MIRKAVALVLIVVLLPWGMAMADEIKVDKEIWDAIEESDRQRIFESLLAFKLLQEDDQIVGVEGLESALAWDPIGDLCRTACDAASAAAAVSCAGSAAAIAACLVVVAAARDACRRGC